MVDPNNLPSEINIQNLDQSSLSLYQLEMVDGNPVYVLTVSGDMFQRTLEPVDKKRSYINFGYGGEASGSGFLDTATGVTTDNDTGYIMIRSGSITGMSTNLEIINASHKAVIEIIIYKNGEALGFGNTLSASKVGTKTDYDLLSEGTITFEAGDVISVYINSEQGVVWRDIITMIEITTVE